MQITGGFSGDELKSMGMQHNGPIAGIAVHGNHIATAGYCNQLILWDAQNHTAVARANHDHIVNQCAFNSNGTLLVSASGDYSARVWEVPSLRLKALLADHEDDVDMAVFSPDDQFIATCALDRCVRVFDLNGQCLHTMRGHTGNVLSLAWSLDGKLLVSSSVDGTVREWDTETGEVIKITNIQVRTDSVAMDKQGRIWAGDDRGRIAGIVNGNATYTPAHEAGIKKIVLASEQNILVTLSYDRCLAVWKISEDGTVKEINRSICPAEIWARAAAILSDNHVVVGTFGSTYAIFDWHTGVWDLTGVAASRAIDAVLCVEGDVYTVGDAGIVECNGQPHAAMGSLCNFLVTVGHRLLTGGQMGELFDAHTGESIYQHQSPLNCATSFMRHGQAHVAIGTYTGEILVFALQNDSTLKLVTMLHAFENAVKGLAASETTLFSVCASTEIAWHSLDDFSLQKNLCSAHERIANACVFMGNNSFASVGRDKVLRIWSELGFQFHTTPHNHSVKCIAINTDNSIIMTGSYTGTVAAFDLRARQWLPIQRPTTSGISSLCWDAVHNQFLAASYDGNVYPVNP